MTNRKEELAGLPLGQAVAFPESYDPTLLAGIPRSAGRERLGFHEGDVLPFVGTDFWRAWEFSWQDLAGVPHVVVLDLRVPSESPAIFESKSLKLYLHGFAGSRFVSAEQVVERIRADLTAIARETVQVELKTLTEIRSEGFAALRAESLDQLKVAIPDVPPEECVPQFGEGPLQLHAFHTDLFGSLCPVTGQPDWASVTIVCESSPLDERELLKYLLAYRRQADFHESCGEKIFTDLWRAGAPAYLSVLCRYTRRGGIDINPLRTSAAGDDRAGRMVRQ